MSESITSDNINWENPYMERLSNEQWQWESIVREVAYVDGDFVLDDGEGSYIWFNSLINDHIGLQGTKIKVKCKDGMIQIERDDDAE